MTIPAFLFFSLVGLLYGTLFHLWRGGGAGKLLLYVLLSWSGFWVGHLLGGYLQWRFAHIGAVNFGMATLVSLLFLALGHWLSQSESAET